MSLMWSIAWYEFKLILRSRIFRLFAILTILAQGAAVALFYLHPSMSRWALRAVPSSIPYTATLIYALFAGIGGIFIATECLGRDLSLGTTDTVYYRNFSAPWYMFGKSVGIMMAMLGLMGVIMLLPLTVNLFFLPDTPAALVTYLLYPLLITVPAMLFTMGVSWLVMLLTKSQAVTFITVVLLFGITMWADRFIGLHHLLDYQGIYIPALYSDFIGFGDAGRLFMQRGLYALLGMSLMAGTPLMLPRLPQSARVRRGSFVLSVALCVTAGVLAVGYIGAFNGDRALRDRMRDRNHQYASHPRPTMTACDLSITHDGGTIDADATLTFRNDNDTPLQTYLFSLNPGLDVVSITSSSGSLPFERMEHLIEVTPTASLAPGASDSLVITYAGDINDRATYLDTPERERTDSFPIAFIPVQRMSGMIDSDFVLLTPETLWYPVAGVPYGSTFPDMDKRDFVQFTLSVDTTPGMVPVSQGLPKTLADGRSVFTPETPLPQLSLTIGPYEYQSVEIDSILFASNVLPGHDFYMEYFGDYGEQFKSFVSQTLNSYETRYYSPYPFDYLTYVEVPIQFSPRQRTWTIVQDNIQPGVVLVSERGTFMQDIPLLMKALEGVMAQIMPEQVGSFLYSNGLNAIFGQSYTTRSNTSSSNASFFSRQTLSRILYTEDDVVYNIFPNYYSFTNNVYSDRWPIINTMLERYIPTRENSGIIVIGSNTFNEADQANMMLAKRNLPEILSSDEPTNIMSGVMSAKVNQLFSKLSSRMGTDEFESRLQSELADSRYRPIELMTLLNAIQRDEAEDLAAYIDDWYTATDLPICQVCEIKHVKVHEDEHEYYQLMVTLNNPSNADGLFHISASSAQAGGGNGTFIIGSVQGFATTMSGSPVERHVEVPAGETRCVCMVSEAPFNSTARINTLISQNLPSTFSITVPDVEEDLTMAVQDTVLALDVPPSNHNPDVIIVDDLSPGCVATMDVEPTWFQKLLYGKKDESEYRPMQMLSSYNEWSRTIDSSFYGDYIKSALTKAPGNGDSPVTWTATLSESGTYDVYAHTAMSMGGLVFAISADGGQPMSITGTVNYTVHHDDGASTIEVESSRDSDSWSFLGTYHFSAGEASVELSDKCDNGRMIMADAVKWVKR